MRNAFIGLVLFSVSVIFTAALPKKVVEEINQEKIGYEICAPIIQAVSKYKSEEKIYPDSLSLLIPNYLDSIPSQINGYPLDYQLSEEYGYVIRYTYCKRELNRCLYSPKTYWCCERVKEEEKKKKR